VQGEKRFADIIRSNSGNKREKGETVDGELQRAGNGGIDLPERRSLSAHEIEKWP